jgi:F-type H+-transporting ATPase subunit gamma
MMANFVQRRGMATEKQLKMRITATGNIAKITKSMKMVSAAKLRGETTRLMAARPFAAWASEVTGEPKDLEDLDPVDMPDNNLIVLLTSDKGLCGGVNSILSRHTKVLLNKLEKENKAYKLLILGEKGRAIFRRQYSDSIVQNITDRTAPYTFSLSSAVANEIVKGDYNGVHILYNRFKSAISNIPSIKSIAPIVDPNVEMFQSKYDMEPDTEPESLTNFYEYTLACHIHHSLMENATSEQSARMSAMENASKNAKEMIGKLTLQYNRARQTRITTELIEIISGAAALETKS